MTDKLRYQGDKEGGHWLSLKVLRPKYLLITILVSTVWKSFQASPPEGGASPPPTPLSMWADSVMCFQQMLQVKGDVVPLLLETPVRPYPSQGIKAGVTSDTERTSGIPLT